MPWKPEDATAHDHKAKTPKAKRAWADVANSVLKATGDEGRAVREANGVVMRREIAKFHGTASAASKRSGKHKATTIHV